MRWTDLTPEQRCLLLNAVEESLLSDALSECIPAPDWPTRLPHVPRLSEVAEGLVQGGLIELYRYDENDAIQDVPADQVRDLLRDPDNWWSADGVRAIALNATVAGRDVFHTAPPDRVYDFREPRGPD